MTLKPIIFETKHIPKFYEIDPFGHLNTIHYPRYFLDHRLEGINKRIGLSMEKILGAPVLVYILRLEVNFIKPVFMDQEFKIKSFIAKVSKKTCEVQCEMLDENALQFSTCQMDCICINSQTKKPCPWPEEYIGQFFEE